jgi:hypothetical protein
MKIAISVAAYLIAGILTSAYWYQHRATCKQGLAVEHCGEVEAIFLIGVWPGYWAWRAALWITK